jgi:hypothetical protein
MQKLKLNNFDCANVNALKNFESCWLGKAELKLTALELKKKKKKCAFEAVS